MDAFRLELFLFLRKRNFHSRLDGGGRTLIKCFDKQLLPRRCRCRRRRRRRLGGGGGGGHQVSNIKELNLNFAAASQTESCASFPFGASTLPRYLNHLVGIVGCELLLFYLMIICRFF